MISAEGHRRKEATNAKMGMAKVPPAITNMFNTSRSILLSSPAWIKEVEIISLKVAKQQKPEGKAVEQILYRISGNISELYLFSFSNVLGYQYFPSAKFQDQK